MSDQFIGEIRIFALNFAPVGWALCNGQLLPVSQNPALFSLLGTNYGGDGRSTFALPNLQGAVPINQGTGSGLSPYDVGQSGGTPTVTLLQTEMCAHTHTLNADQEAATSSNPANSIYMEGHYVVSDTDKGQAAAYTKQTPNAILNPQALGLTGGNLPHNNLMPYLTLNFCIALNGIFPPRS
jgi:microcystin-dependent protein